MEPDRIDMMDEQELRNELRYLIEWQWNMKRVIDPYLTDDDGSDLIPDHARVNNMLKRLSAEQNRIAADCPNERLVRCDFLGTPDPEFNAFVDVMPEKHWARYDLSAVRLGWEAYKALHT